MSFYGQRNSLLLSIYVGDELLLPRKIAHFASVDSPNGFPQLGTTESFPQV